MTKMNKLIPLFVLPLLLTACGNSNKVEKPKFAKYGNEVTFEVFTGELNTKSKEARVAFLQDDETGLLNASDDFSIDYMFSSEENAKEEGTGIKEYSYISMHNTVKVDQENKRAEGNLLVKSSYKGNREKDDPYYQENGNEKSEDYLYAEIKEDKFYYASSYKKEYKHMTLTEPAAFASAGVQACLDATGLAILDVMFFGRLGLDSETTTHYFNGNVFTTIEVQSGVTVTRQAQYSESECSYKIYQEGKGTADDVETSGKGSATLIIKKGNVSVSAFDYSSYTDATLVM